MSGLSLRPYQQEALIAARASWARGIRRTSIVLATGLGKTVIFAHLAAEWRDSRVIVLVHSEELVSQAVAKIKAVSPGIDVGIVRAGTDEVDAHVVVATVQTLRSSVRRERIRNVGLIVVDECHHATALSYLDVLDHYGGFRANDDPTGALVLGVTATMRRGDGIALGQVWEEVCYERGIIDGIRMGFLADVRGVAVTVEDLDMGSVRSTAGDYRESDLGAALADSSAPQVIAKAYNEHAPESSGLVFTPTVETAQLLAEVMTEAGTETRAVWGSMTGDDRRRTLAEFRRGDVQALANCMLLTEGYDEPRASTAVVARPTQSSPLYIQMVGRVLRPYPGKKQALVLDVAGVSARHSLVGLTTLGGATIPQSAVPLEDESLLDMVDRLEAEAEEERLGVGARRDHLAVKPAAERDVDLFHGSRLVWQQTGAGFWYVHISERYVALVPSPMGDSFDVAWFGESSGGAWIERDVPDIGYAMAYAETHAAQQGYGYASKKAGWRKTSVPSPRQLARCAKLRVTLLEGATAGDASDAISRAEATRRIDSVVVPYLSNLAKETPA